MSDPQRRLRHSVRAAIGWGTFLTLVGGWYCADALIRIRHAADPGPMIYCTIALLSALALVVPGVLYLLLAVPLSHGRNWAALVLTAMTGAYLAATLFFLIAEAKAEARLGDARDYLLFWFVFAAGAIALAIIFILIGRSVGATRDLKS